MNEYVIITFLFWARLPEVVGSPNTPHLFFFNKTLVDLIHCLSFFSPLFFPLLPVPFHLIHILFGSRFVFFFSSFFSLCNSNSGIVFLFIINDVLSTYIRTYRTVLYSINIRFALIHSQAINCELDATLLRIELIFYYSQMNCLQWMWWMWACARASSNCRSNEQ